MFYQKIDLGSAWQEVQEYILTKVVPNEPSNLQSRLFGLKDIEFMTFAYKTLKAPLEKYGFSSRIPKRPRNPNI